MLVVGIAIVAVARRRSLKTCRWRFDCALTIHRVCRRASQAVIRIDDLGQLTLAVGFPAIGGCSPPTVSGILDATLDSVPGSRAL
jgi:hypothetical protein